MKTRAWPYLEAERLLDERVWLSITKNGEKVKIFCRGDKYGYQKPNMRTRYYTIQIDADYFVKV